MWQLLKTFAALAPERALQVAVKGIESDIPQIRAGALLVMLASRDLDALIAAAPSLKEMLSHPAPEMRAAAARAIEGLGGGSLQKELVPLLGDPDETVRAGCRKGLRNRPRTEIIELLAAQVGTGKVWASRRLRSYQNRSAGAGESLGCRVSRFNRCQASGGADHRTD